MYHRETITNFAKIIHKLLRSDRDVNVGVGGFTGEGKTTFSGILQKEYAKVSGTYWGFDRMTWSRPELMKWIDGEGPDKTGQLPEYSAVLPDELFSMFYSRTWYDGDQIDAIKTFNMCRDRHLFLCGNVPNFWELDKGFTNRIRYYVYIPERGIAWVFKQEVNPFGSDPWNPRENKKIFRKTKQPYAIHNFLFEVRYPDWKPEEKKEYLAIRNIKRVKSIADNRKKPVKSFPRLTSQRNQLLRAMFDPDRKCSCGAPVYKAFNRKKVGVYSGISPSRINDILVTKERPVC